MSCGHGSSAGSWGQIDVWGPLAYNECLLRDRTPVRGVVAHDPAGVEGGCSHVTSVVRDRDESFESLFKRFRKSVQQDRIMSEVRQRRFFEKPSVVRKRKAAKKRIKSRRTTLKAQRRRY